MKTGLILTGSKRYLCSSPERGLLISVVYERKFFSELPQKEDDLKYGKCSFPQTLMNLYVQPGGLLFSPLIERNFFPEIHFPEVTKMIVKAYLIFFTRQSGIYLCWFLQSGGYSFRLTLRERGIPRIRTRLKREGSEKNDQKVKPSNAYESLCSARGLQFSPLSEGIFPRFHSGMTNKTFRTEAVLFDALSG